MNREVIARAEEIINSKTGYIGGGMEGYAALALIDENGYPTASTLTIAKADGIKWLTFCTTLDDNKAKRIKANGRACVCINSSEYNITLVGTAQVLTDAETKHGTWLPSMESIHWSGPDDPNFCVLRFNTERYNLFISEPYGEAQGTLKSETASASKEAEEKTAPRFEPILIYNNGQCAQAIELYKKAFGAQVTHILRYSEENPEEVPYSQAQKDYIMNAQIKIGAQTMLVCDDTQSTQVGKNIQIVLEFDDVESVNAAYNAMLEGATDLTPPHSVDYSPCVAYLTDAYGIPWQLMVWHGY